MAEEALHALSTAAYAPFLAYAVAPAARLDVLRFTRPAERVEDSDFADLDDSLFDSDVTSLRISRRSAPSDQRYYNELSRQPSVGNGLLADQSIMLFRTRVPTRFNYPSYAGFQSGYGRVFSSPDTIGRTRTNGAGIDDPSCLYLKMSLNF